ncbi:MAG: hypothetical protein GKR94_13535 [Gammaproteobacteria bacterium]|nr:hypothetical protein [Gammaproteobacteria bacterium]
MPTESKVVPFPEVVSILKDIVLAGAAVTGAIVAVKGLGTWRRQLTGQSEYELTRRLLVGVFKYRDAIDRVRDPAILAYEMPEPSSEQSQNMTREQIRFYGLQKAYERRWEKVQGVRTAMYLDYLEAEAIWGEEVTSLFKALFELEKELLTISSTYRWSRYLWTVQQSEFTPMELAR